MTMNGILIVVVLLIVAVSVALMHWANRDNKTW